jgi:hypothetical protein
MIVLAPLSCCEGRSSYWVALADSMGWQALFPAPTSLPSVTKECDCCGAQGNRASVRQFRHTGVEHRHDDRSGSGIPLTCPSVIGVKLPSAEKGRGQEGHLRTHASQQSKIAIRSPRSRRNTNDIEGQVPHAFRGRRVPTGAQVCRRACFQAGCHSSRPTSPRLFRAPMA